MRSLGKKKVVTIIMRDGAFKKTLNENRVVYEKSDGTFHINYLRGYRQVQAMGDGSFGRTENVVTISTKVLGAMQ